MRVIRSDEAVVDIIETADYIVQDDIDAAIRFADAVDEAFKLIARSPKIGTAGKVNAYPSLRMWIVKGFPNVLIFYRATASDVYILRVIHSARDFYRIFDEE